MERIEIYSNKKKSLLLLIGSLLFVGGGIYMFMNAETFTGYRARSPFFIKTIGIASVLFFGLGIYKSIRQLLANQLILIIDKKGVNIKPDRADMSRSLAQFCNPTSLICHNR
ncbi:STM3941 family protein [Flavobacterium sp. LS2P90]|uniref:STM3941 family protein n=1 Tax=Flavobacterium xylosi TaxID=3230415 RepID=A0ABW6HXL5_9FLAO